MSRRLFGYKRGEIRDVLTFTRWDDGGRWQRQRPRRTGIASDRNVINGDIPFISASPDTFKHNLKRKTHFKMSDHLQVSD
jgi:hypothetical protein